MVSSTVFLTSSRSSNFTVSSSNDTIGLDMACLLAWLNSALKSYRQHAPCPFCLGVFSFQSAQKILRYLIVTSETEMSDGAVIEAYGGLWRIEESFRVTKSDLEARPVYVSRQEHIEAHFLTCYVALCILRIMQARCGGRYSAGRIAGELAALSCTNVADNWWVFDHRSEVTDELCRMAGFDASRRFARTKDIKAMFSKAKRGPGSAT